MFTVDNTLKAFQLFIQKVEDNHVYLSELDTPIGDGDHGYNMNRGVKALSNALEGLKNLMKSPIFFKKPRWN